MNQPGLGVVVPIVSLIVSVVAWYIMCVSTDAHRRSPVKWQHLALFTAGEAMGSYQLSLTNSSPSYQP
mgnify:CR=1 FL=1